MTDLAAIPTTGPAAAHPGSVTNRASPKTPELPEWVDRAAFPFQPRRAQLRDGAVSYVDEGAGEPVLLVHGTPTWSFEYRTLIRALAPSHRVIAVDNLGFGLSERPREFAYTPEAHARVLREFVERLGIERFSLVTHDYGGPFALPLVVDDPRRVRKLVLFNSWMWNFDDTAALRFLGGSFGRFLYRRFNLSLRTLMPQAFGDRKKLTPELHQQYLQPFAEVDARGRVLWPLARAFSESRAYFDSLWERRARLANTDALIIWGERDRLLPPALLERWREALPHATVETLSDAGHWPHEEAPEAVAQRVRGFLNP